MKEKTNLEGWGKMLSHLPDSYAHWLGKEKEFLIRYVAKDSKVLEIGCGEGRSLKYLLKITKNIVGIDNNSKAIEDLKSRLKDVDIQLADGKDLPFEDNSFDFVLCIGNTFGDFGKNRSKVLSEMTRVAKKRGEIFISVYNEDAMEERLKIYRKIGAPIKEIIGGKVFFENLKDIESSEQFSKEELEEIFKEAGLEILEIKKEGIGYFCRLEKK